MLSGNLETTLRFVACLSYWSIWDGLISKASDHSLIPLWPRIPKRYIRRTPPCVLCQKAKALLSLLPTWGKSRKQIPDRIRNQCAGSTFYPNNSNHCLRRTTSSVPATICHPVPVPLDLSLPALAARVGSHFITRSISDRKVDLLTHSAASNGLILGRGWCVSVCVCVVLLLLPEKGNGNSYWKHPSIDIHKGPPVTGQEGVDG